MYRVPFIQLPGFSQFDPEGFEHLFPTPKPALEYYNSFKTEIFSAIQNKTYLPVMRMCDGEYIYSIGKRRGFKQSRLVYLKLAILRLFKIQKTSWGETYTRQQNRELKKKFPELLRFISQHGYIANHFFYTRHRFCEEYIEPMIQWYKRHGIKVDTEKFASFYFVYVLLNGPDSLKLFKDRRVLVISSFAEEKRRNTAAELKRRGAADVFFEAVSATSSMLDVLDLAPYKGKADIVLIAAGIGSANILRQCEVLQVPCIDSGFCLECIANPAVRPERIYCVPDTEF